MNILVITEVKHIGGVSDILEKCGNVKYLDDPNPSEILECIESYHVIFTNPNKTKIYLGEKIIDAAKKLKLIVTASTGTIHIDLNYTRKKKIEVICLKEERKIINSITSTAEHAFALTLATVRNIVLSNNSVLNGFWDYTNFIGRQLNFLNVGIIGLEDLEVCTQNMQNVLVQKCMFMIHTRK